MITEDSPHTFQLSDITQRSRCSVHIDIIHILRHQPRILKRKAYHPRRTAAVGKRRSYMVGISTHSRTCNLCVYTGTPRQSVLSFLKNKNSRSFTHNKTVTGRIEGT